MVRAVHVLMLVLFLGQSVGVLVLGGDGNCAAGCEDDARGKQCPPICPTCACAPHASLAMPASPIGASLTPPAAESDCFAAPQRTPPSPEPHEILHVPRSLLA